VIAQRVFAIIAAVLLVGSVALATLGPPGLPLGQLIFMIDHDIMQSLRTGIEGHVAAWLWAYGVVPLLVRPAWLLPAGLGLICTGAALSASGRKSPRRSHRRS
jgi:hypothetical protein